MKISPLGFGLILALGGCTVPGGAIEGISASGQCKKIVPRDRLSVLFTSVQVHDSSKEASQQAQQRYESFRKGVEELKLENYESQTTSISLSPRVEWINNRNVNKGYEARASLQVTTSSLERVNELYDLAAKVGINEFGSLNMFVSDGLFDAAYKDCLKAALLDARSKAQEIAAAAGKSLGELRQASEQGAGHSPMPMAMAKSMRGGGGMEMADASPVTIDPGTGEIEVRVNATFGL